MVLKKILTNDDILMRAIETVELGTCLIFDEIEIVKAQRKFSYYDIVLIMTRFHCGLTESLFVVNQISHRARELGYAIGDEEELCNLKNKSC
jgi:hypothetical protein